MTEKKFEHNRRHFNDKVSARLATDGQSFPDFKAVFAHFRSYDPSQSGAYTTWLIKTYCEGGFLFEDLAKAKETLQWFDEFKRRLPVGERNIADYPTLADLWKAVKPFVETPEEVEPSKREQRQKEQEEVYTETIFLEETDNFRAVIPLTERASKWWGRGTRWCTAAEKNNAFDAYSNMAPLIIFDFKNGHKWQLFVSDPIVSFMDEDDCEVTSGKLRDKWKYMKKYIFFSLSQKSYSISTLLKVIPNSLKTYEFCLDIVKLNAHAVNHIPTRYLYMSPNLCDIAVRNHVDALKFIPLGMRTPALCLYSVQQKGLLLADVPMELRTPQICEAAIRQNEKSIEYAPSGSLSSEFCMTIIKKNGGLLQLLSEESKTFEICLAAVEQNGMALRHVPESMITEALCTKAINQNGAALQFVPPEMKTYELCLEAMKTSGGSIVHVPSEFKSYEMHLESVKENGSMLYCVPRKFYSNEIFLAAIGQSGISIQYVPLDFRTPDLFMKAVQKDWFALSHVPDEQKTPEMCLSAVLQKNCQLSLIPSKFLTSDICLHAVCSLEENIKLVPKHILTDDFYRRLEQERQKTDGKEDLDGPKTTNGTDLWIKAFRPKAKYRMSSTLRKY